MSCDAGHAGGETERTAREGAVGRGQLQPVQDRAGRRDEDKTGQQWQVQDVQVRKGREIFQLVFTRVYVCVFVSADAT